MCRACQAVLSHRANQRSLSVCGPQSRHEQGGHRVVRALATLLAAEREDQWVRQITGGE